MTKRLLSELFASTDNAKDAAIERKNLNLITIPVKNAAEGNRAIAKARIEPGPSADALMQKYYDFGQAALLLASVCRPDRGDDVMKACGSSLPDGPMLVTTQLYLDGAAGPERRLLLVNFSNVRVEAIPQVLAYYRRQILIDELPATPSDLGWRVKFLNTILEAAHMLPDLSRAYAAGK